MILISRCIAAVYEIAKNFCRTWQKTAMSTFA